MLNYIFKRFTSTEHKISQGVIDFVKFRQTTKCFDNIFNHKWKLISAPENEGTCLIEIKVDETLINAKQVIHGGALASLIDAVSTIALFNTPKQKPGVSVDMNISYIRPALMNDCLLVEGRVVKSGGKIAFLKADVYVKENDSFLLNEDKLVARGTHTKYVL